MVRAIVGANWGDEGKGKITDLFAGQSDIVIRFQGGANAGHTIITNTEGSHSTLCRQAYAMTTPLALSATVLHLILTSFAKSSMMLRKPDLTLSF